MRERRRPAAALWALLGLGWAAAACTSYRRELAEFDSVTRIDAGESWPDAADYRSDPARLSWVARRIAWLGPGDMVLDSLGVEPAPSEIENPSGFARTSAQWLTDFAVGDLDRTAEVAPRLLWMLDADEVQPMNQASALVGLERLVEPLGFVPSMMRVPDPDEMSEERVAAWLATLQQHWPTNRDGPLEGEARAAYLDALVRMTALPQVAAADRRTLIVALDRGLANERDDELYDATRGALLRALFHGTAMGLRGSLRSEAALVREAAISALHRLGGADAVPLLLALVVKPPEAAALNRFDDDPFVRMTLVRICAQLDRERAMVSVGPGPAPVELLYEISSLDTLPNLRQAALEGLALVLERPVELEGDWAEAWWRDEYVPRRAAEGSGR